MTSLTKDLLLLTARSHIERMLRISQRWAK